MLDIARNFAIVEHLKKLVGIISSYKLNVLRFHFPDDEGWHLGIPGSEELISIGVRRGHTMNELECLYLSYDGSHDPSAAISDSRHYTRERFIDLSRYATQRHMHVIPEIKSLGHAHAAIASMKVRYHKYVDTVPEKANEYLLGDT